MSHMGRNQVDPAEQALQKRVPAKGRRLEVVDHQTSERDKVSSLQVAVAGKLADGVEMSKVVRIYQHHLAPHEGNREKRLKIARGKIRRWMKSQKFRDLLWEETVLRVDFAAPGIISGLIGKAQAGRVDAARLLFELNGRHSPNTEVTPSQVNIILDGVPRPSVNPQSIGVDADEKIEDAEFYELED